MPFDEYLTNLRVLSRSCEVLEADNMVIDKTVFCTKEKTLKERLLRETQAYIDTSLQKVIDLCRSAEITKKEIQSMQSVKCDTSSSTESIVHVIKSRPQGSPVNDTKISAGALAINMHLVNAPPRVRPVLNAMARIIFRENADQKEGFTK